MTHPESPDALAVARVRDGDHTAFETVFRAHYPGLCAFAVRLVGARALAEDVVQEVFRRIWEGRERWDVRDTIKTYLYRAVRNEALNHLRHRRVEDRLRTGPAAGGAGPGMGQGPEAIEGRLEAEELAAVIESVMEDLPDRCREVFVLKWQGNLRYAEIAAVMKISVKTVENQMHRALRAVRERLAAHDG